MMIRSLFRAIFFLVGLTAWTRYIIEGGGITNLRLEFWVATIAFGIYFAIQDSIQHE